jgi:adenine deaminase
MATIQAAEYFGLQYQGAIAPGYIADIVILNNIENIEICDVYTNGKLAVKNGVTLPFKKPKINSSLKKAVYESFNIDEVSTKDFYIKPCKQPCRIIKIIPEQITTEELIEEIEWSKNNGIDLERDILKLAVLERHNNTGHKGIGFINGIGLKKGAIASSVSHDSHNIIVIGTNDADMAIAANRIREKGGNVVVLNGEIIAEMPLCVAGLMSEHPSDVVVAQNASVRRAVCDLGVKEGIEPFMNMAFVSLSVIPDLKMTTQGLLDVKAWNLVPLEI